MAGDDEFFAYNVVRWDRDGDDMRIGGGSNEERSKCGDPELHDGKKTGSRTSIGTSFANSGSYTIKCYKYP